MKTIVVQPGEEILIVGEAKSSGNGAAAPSVSGENSMVGGKKRRGTRKAQKGGKRGPNPFMKFAAKERKNIMSSNPGMPVTEVGKELGKRWRALSDAEKAKF